MSRVKFSVSFEGDLSEICQTVGENLIQLTQLRVEAEAREDEAAQQKRDAPFRIVEALIPLAVSYLSQTLGSSKFTPPTPGPIPGNPAYYSDEDYYDRNDEEEEEEEEEVEPEPEPEPDPKEEASDPPPVEPSPLPPNEPFSFTHAILGNITPEKPITSQIDFNTIPLDTKAWTLFVEYIEKWLQGFECPLDEDGKPTEPQPKRDDLIREMGQGRWPAPMMRWVHNYGSLQRALLQALWDLGRLSVDPCHPGETPTEEEIEFADRLAMNMVQVSHAGFPDLADFYDHSTRWRRSL